MASSHRTVFIAHNGPGPYDCWVCSDPVTLSSVTVHHLNHDHNDNRPENLAAAHRGCHSRYHSGEGAGSERRAKIAAGMRASHKKRQADRLNLMRGMFWLVRAMPILRASPDAAELVREMDDAGFDQGRLIDMMEAGDVTARELVEQLR